MTEPAPPRGVTRWGLLFVVLLVVCEGAVALPETSRTTAFIAAYYREHRTAVLLAQAGELIATLFLWFFVLRVARTAPVGRGRTALRLTGAAVCAASVLTSAPVIALAVRPTAGTRLLATWTDLTDVILDAALAGFGAACALALPRRWARAGGAVLAVLSAARLALAAVGAGALGTLLPLAFLLFVAAVAIAARRWPVALSGYG